MSLAVFLAATTVLVADPFDYKAAAVDAAKQFDSAEKAVAASLSRCATSAEPDECVGYLQFTLGYVLVSRDDAASLPRAEAAYGDAAKAFAKNAQLRANLAAVLLREGKIDAAAKAFEMSATLDQRNAASRYLAAADAFRLAGVEWQALPLYRKAIDAGSPEAASALVSMMAGWIEHAGSSAERDSRIRQTFDIGRDLRTRGALGTAAEAFETVMTYHTQMPAIASEALAAWTEARAGSRTLSASALARLPSDWSSPFLQGLTETVKRGKWAFADGSRTSQFERYASAAAAKAVADNLLARGNKASALALYTRAMDESPIPKQQDSIPELKSLPVVFLDAAVQIARITTATGDKATFAKVEHRLFDAKMEAYQSNNRAAVQRMHTVLGTIYAERGTWTSANPLTNATFQLSHALSTAKQREKDEGILQPLPYLHETLAKSYRVQNRLSEASSEDLAAARDYLDVDALGPARAALNRAEARSSGPGHPVSFPNSESYETLESILDYREGVPTVDWKKNFSLPKWTDSSAARTTVENPEFLARQQFKTLADLSSAARRKGDSEAAEAFSAGAFEAVKGQKTYGTADSLRLIDIKTADPKKPQSAIEPERWKYLLEQKDPKSLQTLPNDKPAKYEQPSSWKKIFELPVTKLPDAMKDEQIKIAPSAAAATTVTTTPADAKKTVKPKLTTEDVKKDEEMKSAGESPP
jgi:tetratricopeptide (TPR) repeat protein